MAISQNFPNQLPALSLNFAGSKLLDPRITFTRSSSATYVDDDGLIKTASTDVPRFEHNPVTGECLGLLIEDSRTNLLQYSIPDNTNWTNSASSLSINNSTSPDGTLTATLFTGIGDNTVGHYILRNQSVTSGVTYTQTFFVKAGTTEFVQIAPSTGFNSRRANFQLTGEGVVGNYDTPIPPTIQRYPNGWYRIRVTETATLSTSGGRMVLASIDSLTSSRIPQSEPRTFYVWGAQLEAGSFASSYIPTSGSAVTRSQDFAQMTGSNFSSWYTATEGTLYAEYSFNGINGLYNNPVVMLNNGTETYSIFITASDAYGVVNHPSALGGVSFIGTVGGTTSPGVTYKSALAFKLDDFAFTLNGLTPVTDFGGPLPTVDRMYIGRRVTLDSSLHGPIKRLVYYPVKFTNSQIQSLTK